MLKWDYTVVLLVSSTFEDPNFTAQLQAQLQSMGDQGWELVAVVQWIAFFKRQSLTQVVP